VPFISAYLIWLRFGGIKQARVRFALGPGLGMVGIGLLLLLVDPNSSGIFLPCLSFFLVVAGLTLALFGKTIFKEVGFPLFFLVTMIPLPEPVYFQLAEWMRQATAGGAVGLLKIFGFPIFREGYHVEIPNLSLFISPGCSGIRYLIPYFVFGLAYAYACKKTLPARALIVIATIPLAIMAGVARQTLIIVSAHYIGPFMAEHRPHVMISWAVFLSALVAAMWIEKTVKGIR
jgi:exosortase